MGYNFLFVKYQIEKADAPMHGSVGVGVGESLVGVGVGKERLEVGNCGHLSLSKESLFKTKEDVFLVTIRLPVT